MAENEKTDSDGVSGHEFYVILDQVYQYQPDINLDDFVKQHNFSAFKKKCNDTVFNNFTFVNTSKYIRLIEVYDNIEYPSIKTSITVNQNFDVDVVIHDQKLSTTHIIWTTCRQKINCLPDLQNLVQQLSMFNVCIGNPEAHYQDKLPVGYYPEKPTDT